MFHLTPVPFNVACLVRYLHKWSVGPQVPLNVAFKFKKRPCLKHLQICQPLSKNDIQSALQDCRFKKVLKTQMSILTNELDSGVVFTTLPNIYDWFFEKIVEAPSKIIKYALNTPLENQTWSYTECSVSTIKVRMFVKIK